MEGLRGELGADAAGKYRIVMPLGQGGTAAVYLAVADGPGGFRKLVVLKVLKRALAADPEFCAMFLGEARLAARLHHPNVVQTNEILELPGGPVMVMEYLEGQALSQVIPRGRNAGFTLAMQVRVLIDALAGLHAAHELTDFDGTPLGVVHRDVSPHNLFVTVEGQAKVLDFGIAKLANLERSLFETEVGTIKGKIRYMAPEQVAGEKVDRRADVYAAGVILWEALVGERMWQGIPEGEIRARVLAGELPVAELARTGAPASMQRACRRALALSPADRHATALDLADDLDRACAEMPEPAGHREIGATIARLFAEERAETRAAIEGAVESRRTPVAPMEAEERTVVVTTPRGWPEQSSSAPPAAPVPQPQPRPRRRRPETLVLIAGGVAIALLTVASAVWKTGAAPGEATPGPQEKGVPPTAVAETAAPAAPQATPVVAATPATPAAAPAVPRALRDGQSPFKGASKRPAKVGTAARSAAGRSPLPLDCDHPFFVDDQGIKRFRSECM